MAVVAGASKAIDTGKDILKTLNSIKGTLKQASPQFAQSMQILKKGLLLYLRPIGDVISKLFRPFLMIFIKAGLLWYKYLSNLFGTGKDGTEDATDKVGDLEATLGEKTEPGGGGTEGSSGSDWKNANFKPAEGKGLFDGLKKAWDDFLEPGNGFFDTLKLLWQGLVSAGKLVWLGIQTIAVSVWNMGVTLWEALEETWDQLMWDLNALFDDLISLGKDLWKTIAGLWDDTVKVAKDVWTFISGLWEDTVQIAKDVWKFISDWWDTLITNVASIWSKLKTDWDTLITDAGKIFEDIGKAFKKISDAVESAWGLLKSAFNKLLSWIKDAVDRDKDEDKGKGGKAVGGDISSTGMYQLHAGERVLTAAETKRSSGGNYTFNMPVTINAKIDSEMDLRQLARRLAALQEVELRRRVSY